MNIGVAMLAAVGYPDDVSRVGQLLRRLGHPAPRFRFLHPLDAVAIAVQRTTNQLGGVVFKGSAGSYAHTVGLQAVLDGSSEPELGRSAEGTTYCRLNRLERPCDVDFSTGVIAELLDKLLGPDFPDVPDICKVVGELHDNVVSHACGLGYSAAQVYHHPRHREVQIAVADGGRGLLRAVRRAQVQDVQTDAEAIDWCMTPGNTTGRVDDDFAQYIPEDFLGPNPFPESVTTRSDRNNHQGLGLSKLEELVARLPGSTLEVWSGQAHRFVTDSTCTTRATHEDWSGLTVDVRFTVTDTARAPDPESENRRRLREKLGL